MLRILLVTIFLTSGNVESLQTYKVSSHVHFVIPIPLDGNSYIQIDSPMAYDLSVYSKRERESYITFLEDITPDLGFQLSMEWVDGDINMLQEKEYYDFCSVLENTTMQTNPYYPDPIAMLGLSGQHCPIEKSSFRFPWMGLPNTIQAEFVVNCSLYISFAVHIEAKNSTEENPDVYLRAGALGSILCPH